MNFYFSELQKPLFAISYTNVQISSILRMYPSGLLQILLADSEEIPLVTFGRSALVYHEVPLKPTTLLLYR